MKRLALYSILGVAIVGLVVYGQEERAKTASHKNHTSDKGAATTEAPDTSITVINEQTPNQEQNGTENHPKSYLGRLFAPDNLPNIGLFVVGVAGVVIALFTLQKIKEQTTA